MVVIHKNPNSDTRTATDDVTFEEFQKANDMHISDVKNVMCDVAYMFMEAGNIHDYTKKAFEESYYEDFINKLKNNVDFVSNKWYQTHIDLERHHLDARCPEDVDLIDVMEMIVDHVCAGLSRTGEVYKVDIDPNILTKAVNNTVELVKNRIIVMDEVK